MELHHQVSLVAHDGQSPVSHYATLYDLMMHPLHYTHLQIYNKKINVSK